ncbi:MAG: BrnA antitoxin family protein [Candidatus Acidiferrum sp.]
MTKIVRRNFPTRPMTAARKRRFAKLEQLPDSEIDFSDIPELTEKFWKNAVRNPFYRPIKKQVTLRIDADVVAWLRRQGKGYQTRANAVLREAMLRDLREKAS